MTAEKAIDVLRSLMGWSCTKYSLEERIEAFDMAIVAMERRIPKKPFLKDGESIIHVNKGDEPHEWIKGKWQDWVCPVCGWFVGQRYNAVRNNGEVHPHDQRKSNFCNECGQAIDWSENDD